MAARAGGVHPAQALEREFEAILQRVSEREDTARRLRRVGSVWVAAGSLLLSAALLVGLAALPFGLFAGSRTALAVLAGIGGFLAVGLAVLSAPALLAGLGLRAGRAWARPPALGLAALALLWVPLGTLLGGWTLVVLCREDVRALLEEQG